MRSSSFPIFCHKDTNFHSTVCYPGSSASQSHGSRGQYFQACVFKTERLDNSLQRTKFMFKILRRAIHQEQYWETSWRCPIIRCLKQHDSLREMMDHLENCPEFTSQTRPMYLCPDCKMGHHVPGCYLNLKTMGKSLKRRMDCFSSPEESTSMQRHYSMLANASDSMFGETSEDLEGIPNMATTEIAELQAQLPSSQSPLQYPSYFVNPDDQNGSPSGCLLPRNLAVSIPRQDQPFPGHFAQTSPDGSFATSATTLMSPVLSANSEQTSMSFWDGSTLCQCMSPSSGSLFSGEKGYSPTYDCNQAMSMSVYPQILTELPSSCSGFAQADSVAYATAQDDCNMSGLTGCMETYSPSYSLSSDAPNDGRELLEVPPLSYSPDVPYFASQDSSVICAPHERRFAVEADGSQPADDAIGKWPSNNFDGTFAADLSPKQDDSQGLYCTICGWKPETLKDRPIQKRKQAVQKHIKRNHKTENFTCEICKITIKKRRDNLKDHVKRKHPDRFPDLYPGCEAKRGHGKGPSFGIRKLPHQKRLRSKQWCI